MRPARSTGSTAVAPRGLTGHLSTSSGIATAADDHDLTLRGYRARQCCGQALMVGSGGMQLNPCELRRRLTQIDTATCVEDAPAVQKLIAELRPPVVNPSPGSVELADGGNCCSTCLFQSTNWLPTKPKIPCSGSSRTQVGNTVASAGSKECCTRLQSWYSSPIRWAYVAVSVSLRCSPCNRWSAARRMTG